MNDPNNLSAMNAVLDSATETLRRSNEAARVDRIRRERENILELLDQHGLRDLLQLVHDVYDESREVDDRYLDDPRRGQAEQLNREGR